MNSRFNRLFILPLSSVLLVLLTTLASADCPEWLSQLPEKQTYTGIITYLGEPETKDPSEITWTFRPKNCTVVGQFNYFDSLSGKDSAGQFSQTRVLPNRTLETVWHDKYGFGLLKLQFSPDLQSFTGDWGGPYTNVPGGQWTGEIVPKCAKCASPQKGPKQ